jgi:asparagine synthase (glutamine-hydrolysing)
LTALGAISVLGGGAPLSASELEAFRDTHVSLLGVDGGERRLAPQAGAFRLGSRASASRTESDGDAGWALSLGCVHGSERIRDAALGSLDGQFAAVTHDALSATTRIVADPLGMQRYYVGEQGSRLYASTSALAIARVVGAEPDTLGVTTFLTTGGQFGRRTIWEGVERLEPGTVLEVAGGQKRESVYWSPAVDDEIVHESLGGLTARNSDALVDSLRDHLSGAEALLADLTGGFDSRLLTLSLRRAGVPIVSTTTGSEHQADVVIAGEIARRLGLAWRWNQPASPPKGEQALSALDQAVAWADGHLNALEALPVLANHARNGGDFGRLINGGGGEHLRYYAWAQEFPRAGHTRSVDYTRWINYRVMSPIDSGLFREDPVPAVRHDIEERMRPVAARYADHPNTVQLDAMYAYKSTGHFGAWMSLARRDLDVELPYYWKPVFATAFSSSYRYRNHNRLIRHMIARLDPGVARMPTERGGPAEPWRPSNLHRFAPFYTRQLRNLVPRVTHRLAGRALFAHRDLPGGSGIMGALIEQGALDPRGMRSAPLYDRARLGELLARQAGPEASPSALLGRVLTIERALAQVDTEITATNRVSA